MPSRRTLFSTTGLCILIGGLAAPAIAQEATVDLGTLVLRGEKIGRTPQETPSSTSVIPGAEAEAAINSDMDDILDAEPNILANEGFKAPAIRGIDANGGERPAISAGAQPRIPVLVDDVPLPSGEASNLTQTSTWDIDTVEVARGPQATSTGRNTLGGAIRVYTRDPEYFREGALRTTVTDQNSAGLDVMFNMPLIEDQLAFRFTGEFSGGDSYITNSPNPLPIGIDPNDEESKRLRAKLLWEPADVPGLRLLFAAEYSEAKGPTEGFFNGDINDLSLAAPFAFSNSYEDVEQTIYSFRGEYELGANTTLVGRLSWLDSDLKFLDTGEELFPGATFGTTRFQKELAEAEVYLQFQNIGIINKGVFGIIHTTEDEIGSNDGALIPFSLTGDIENTGIYGEVELDGSALAPGMAFILGGRYEIDKRTRTTVDAKGTLVGTGTFEEEVFLPKAGVRYDVNGFTTVGYTYSEGFRGGGLDADLSAPFAGAPFSAVAFSAERLKQHEIYGRTSLLDGALDLKASAFFYKWDDPQVSGAASYPGSSDPAIGNVLEAEGKGIELFAAYRATDRLSFTANLGLLDTEITQPRARQAAFQGLELPRAPNTTAAFGIAWQGTNGFDASAQVRYVGQHFSALGQA